MADSPEGGQERDDRKKRVDQLKARMEGLKRGISYREASPLDNTAPDAGGSAIVRVDRDAERSHESMYGNGAESRDLNQEESAASAEMLTPRTRQLLQESGSMSTKSPPKSDNNPVSSPKVLRKESIEKPKEKRESFVLEPTQDLLSRLIEIQALLTSVSTLCPKSFKPCY